jgi:hypothetical protein
MGGTPTFERFIKTFSANVLSQFVILKSVDKRRDARPVGLLSAVQSSLRDGHTFVSVATDSWAAVPIEAIDLFITYLLSVWPFRRICIDVIETVLPYFEEWIVGGIANEEGRFKDHRFSDGQFFDVITLVIERGSWTSSIFNQD